MIINSCEKKEKGAAEVIIGFTSEEFQSSINKAYIRSKNHITVPGFRKGKAPRKIIEKMLGATIFHNDALEMLMPEAIDYIKKETNLKFIQTPSVTKVDVKDGDEGVDVSISAICYPEVTLGEYKGLAVVKPSAEVLDSDIDLSIERIRDRNASMERVDRPVVDGDIVFIDFIGYIDGEPFDDGESKDYELTIGSNALIPGFEDGLIGMSAGEERVLNLVFPDEFEGNPTLAGMPVLFNVKLNEVKEKILPDLDDEFAKDVSEFDTLEEYRADIKEKMLTEKQKDIDMEFEDALYTKITDSMEVDVPDIMLEEQIDKSVASFKRQISSYGIDLDHYLSGMGMTMKEFRDTRREGSLIQVKTSLALEKIAELEGIEASDEEIESEFDKASESMGVNIYDIKSAVSEETIAREIRKRLASKFVIDNAKALNSEEEQEEEPVAGAVTDKEQEEAPLLGVVTDKKKEEATVSRDIIGQEDEQAVIPPDIVPTKQDGKAETPKKKTERKTVLKKKKGEEIT